MAKKPILSPPNTCDYVGETLNRMFGEGTVASGDSLKSQGARISTGVFMLTYASGGGYLSSGKFQPIISRSTIPATSVALMIPPASSGQVAAMTP